MGTHVELPLQTVFLPRWYALYTKGRHEKFVDAEMKRKKVESFLPLRRIRRQWTDRAVVVEEPLFSSYLFVKTDLRHNSEILSVKGAIKFVGVQSKPIPIEDSVIVSLQNIVSQKVPLDPFPYLKVGQRVYVRSGLFKGVEGYIVRKDDKRCRLVISIDAITASISIDVDACLVERI